MKKEGKKTCSTGEWEEKMDHPTFSLSGNYNFIDKLSLIQNFAEFSATPNQVS